MKGKLLLGLTIATLISANTFALEIYKGKLLKHKEWSTGGAQGSFKNVATNLADFKLHANKTTKSSEPFLQAFTHAAHTKTLVGATTLPYGQYQIYIYNDTDSSQTYRYFLDVCVELSANQTKCISYFDELSLEAGGYAVTTEQPMLLVNYDTPGNYKIYLAAGAINENPSSDATAFESMSSSHATIEVISNKG
jgi:hypothetical protein